MGVLAMVEPGTGEVKAVAQSRPMGAKKREGETYLNYTVPSEYGDANGFQAGSTFKAFTLAAALEAGLPLSHVVPLAEPDDVQNAVDFAQCSVRPRPRRHLRRPPTRPLSGPMNMYSGTRYSVNTYFMQLEAGDRALPGVRDGRRDGRPPDQPRLELFPYLTLGVADVSPLEMAEAYATFGARGLHCDARPVLEIRDAARNVIKEYPANCDQVMEQSTADAVNDVLRGVIEGGFASAEALSVPAAGKTGTTGVQAGSPTVAFVGYTPQLATAAIIAGLNDSGQPIFLEGLTIGGNYISSVSGSGFAAPMWGDAMKAIDDTLDYDDFVYPSTVEGAGVTRVPAPERPGRGGGRRRRRRRRRTVGTAMGTAMATATATATAATAAGTAAAATAAAGSAQPSWRRTSAATAAPSALPLTWGVTTPITLPMPFMPSAAAPVCSMAAVTISAISLGSSCWGR